MLPGFLFAVGGIRLSRDFYCLLVALLFRGPGQRGPLPGPGLVNGLFPCFFSEISRETNPKPWLPPPCSCSRLGFALCQSPCSTCSTIAFKVARHPRLLRVQKGQRKWKSSCDDPGGGHRPVQTCLCVVGSLVWGLPWARLLRPSASYLMGKISERMSE